MKIDFQRSTVIAKRLAMLPNVGFSPRSEERDLGSSGSYGATIHLDIIPAGPDSKVRTAPRVLIIFSRLSLDFQGVEVVESAVITWKIDLSHCSLHSALSQLGSGSSTSMNVCSRFDRSVDYP